MYMYFLRAFAHSCGILSLSTGCPCRCGSIWIGRGPGCSYCRVPIREIKQLKHYKTYLYRLGNRIITLQHNKVIIRRKLMCQSLQQLKSVQHKVITHLPSGLSVQILLEVQVMTFTQQLQQSKYLHNRHLLLLIDVVEVVNTLP